MLIRKLGINMCSNISKFASEETNKLFSSSSVNKFVYCTHDINFSASFNQSGYSITIL
jgi:hypothetical protein